MPNDHDAAAPIQAVLFDLDGTLIDTLTDLAQAMNQALAELSAPPHPTDAYRLFVGDGVELLARRALPPELRDASSVERCVAAMQRRYAECWAQTTRPYEGIPELLDQLQERQIPLAILSNKPHSFTVEIVEALLPRWRFDPVFGARPDVPRKPDPTAAQEVCARRGIPARRWMMVGDSGSDMAMARAAEMRGVGVLWGFRDAEELSAAGAWRLIREPDELLRLLIGD